MQIVGFRMGRLSYCRLDSFILSKSLKHLRLVLAEAQIHFKRSLCSFSNGYVRCVCARSVAMLLVGICICTCVFVVIKSNNNI